MKIHRRDLVAGGLVTGLAAFAGTRKPVERPARPAAKSPVVALRAQSYDANLPDLLERGIRECGLDVRNKRVLLKPNMVEFDSRTVINTDARIVMAALEVFQRLGAVSVVIGEGPGHRRDTFGLADEAGYERTIPDFHRIFTDLNRDDVRGVADCFPGGEFFFPASVLQADVIVSMAKMKTHHWAGATLSMKNLFGLVPGSVYGWPKNQLHYFGITASILALNRYFRERTFAIVDGIVAMEGNGPIQGTPKTAQTVVLGKDLVAVDATCCRIMGIDPARIAYLSDAWWGQIEEGRIVQRGEAVASLTTKFELLSAFQHLRALGG